MKIKCIKPSLKFGLSACLAVLLLLSLAGCKGTAAAHAPEITPWQAPKVSTASILSAAAEPDPDGVQLIDVSTAEQGAMLIVNFKGPAKLVQNWNQGSIFLVEETTGTAYDQIPVSPVVGALFGKPKTDGQPGYVMLTNTNMGLKSGSTVTVVLGKYKRVHYIVK